MAGEEMGDLATAPDLWALGSGIPVLTMLI